MKRLTQPLVSQDQEHDGLYLEENGIVCRSFYGIYDINEVKMLLDEMIAIQAKIDSSRA